MADWQSFSIQVPGEDLLEKVRSILETLMTFLEILKAILDTIKAFLIDFGNPIKALVEALIKLINDLFNALQRTGIYALFDVPNPLKDPNFNRFVGGFQAFTTRFKGSLTDSKDPNRPQPIAGLTKSGFVLLVVDAEGPLGLLRLIKVLLRFFGKDFAAPQYGAPANFKVLPIKYDATNPQGGDPILAIANVFGSQPKSLVVEWALPPSGRPGDPGFSDLVTAFSTDFFPPQFLIEKSEVNPNVEIDAGKLGDSSAAGRVTFQVATNFEARGAPGKTIMRKVRMTDEYGDPFVKMQKYIVVNTSSNAGTFFLGQLGTFRYIDNDVEPGKAYWYRVRAFSGSLAVSGTAVSFKAPELNVTDRQYWIRWPGTDPKDPPTMGRASPIIRARVPLFPSAKFDVIENLKRIFQCAFSLNFHLPADKADKFDSQGLNIDPTLASEIGKGSLTDYAGPLVSFQSVPLIGKAAGLGSAGETTNTFSADPVTGALPEMPWQMYSVQSNSTRLSTIVAGAMLEANNADAFRTLMTGPLPYTPSSTLSSTVAAQATTLSTLVFQITNVQDPTTVDKGTAQDAASQFGDIFADPNVRRNILKAVNFCKSFTLGGTPPDWIQVSLLRDIIPWSGQLLYELLAKIQALIDAFRGVIDEIKNFIDLIERKINTLEQFIQYLISLLDFIESLSLGVYILAVPELSGDIGDWISAVDNAGGTPPPSGPGGYTGGVALAYLGADISAFVSAFNLIF